MKYNHFAIKNQNGTFEWLQPELVSEVKRCDGPLNILLCVCAQIRSHYITFLQLAYIFIVFVLFIMKLLNKCLN